jgi:hypothetical protein
MTAIIWKELRENLKWAVLWAIPLTIGMALAAMNEWDSLCSKPFVAFTLSVSCIGGFLLGLGQVVPERARDQWAFLMHRPLSPTRIFLSKVIAGSGLYLAAMLIPLFLAAFWVSRPGRIPAPFDWRMTSAGVVLILNGMLYYFSALIIGTRRARWYASAILPLSIAVVSTVDVFWVAELWQALSIIVIGLAIVAPAAWGSFMCGGQYRSQPLAARAALGLTIVCGFMMISSVLEMALSRWGRAHDVEPPLWSFSYTFGSEAQIVRVAYNFKTRSRTVTDLEGKHAYLGADVPMNVLRRAYSDPAPYQAGRVFSADRYMRRISLDAPVNEQWYYCRHEGLLLGYDVTKRELVGSIGPAGFVPAGQQPRERFEDALLDGSLSGQNSDLLAFPTGLYRLSLARRRLEPVFSAVPAEPITLAARLWESWGKYEGYSLAVVSGNHVRVLDENGRELFSFDLQWPDYLWVCATRSPDGERYIIWYLSSDRRERGPEHVVELASDGRELRRYDLPPLANLVPEPRWRRPILLSVLNALNPLGRSAVWGPMNLLLTPEPYQKGEFGEGLRSFVHDLLHPNLFVTPMLVSGSLCAVGTWLLARRRGFERRPRRLWTAIGFLAGPAGILTLLVLRGQPSRVACPACGKPRVVTRNNCEHCGVAFTRPAPDPADIFEDAPADHSLATAV